VKWPLAVAASLAVGALGGVLAADLRPEPATVITAGQARRFLPPQERAFDFHLRDQNGQVMSLAAARGKVVLLTFLYSTCRDLCPAQAAKIKQAALNVGLDDLEVYGVSVDPVGDTRARVKAWVKRMGLEGAPVHFLIGSRRQLRPVWRAYGITPIGATPAEARAAAAGFKAITRYQPVHRAPSAAVDDPYPDSGDQRYRGRPRHHAGEQFEHTAYVLLIDRDGQQRVGIPFEQLRPAALAEDLRVLISET
jgi:protein SCO1